MNEVEFSLFAAAGVNAPYVAAAKLLAQAPNITAPASRKAPIL
jgi:hypothetical protein